MPRGVRVSEDLEMRGFPVTDNVLPLGWLLTNLGNVVANLQSGFACGNHNSEGRGIIHLRPMNISTDGRLVLNDVRFVEVEVPNWLQPGDVLFNNTNSSELVGKTALASNSEKYAFSNHMTRIRVSSAVEASFVATELQYLFRHGYFKVHCNNHVSQASISAKYLHDRLPFIVPPLPEQRRIVAKIEALQSRSRKAREALEAIPPLLEQFRQSVLAAAFRGDLTADWREQHPEVEPASVLLDRIRTERRRKWEEWELIKFKAKGKIPKDDSWKDRYVEPESVDDSDLPELPEGWCWASVDQIGFLKSGKRLPKGSSLVPHDTGYPYVRAGNLKNGTIQGTILYLTESDYKRVSQYKIFEDDLYLTIVGASIGDTGICPKEFSGSNLTENAARVALVGGSLPGFLAFMIRSPQFDTQIQERVLSAAQGKLALLRIKQLCIPICPREEQSVIAKRIVGSLARIDYLTQMANTFAGDVTGLDQSILAKAFRGELVPQDPDDEPASQLLERIQSERADDTNAKPTRGRRKRTSAKDND